MPACQRQQPDVQEAGSRPAISDQRRHGTEGTVGGRGRARGREEEDEGEGAGTSAQCAVRSVCVPVVCSVLPFSTCECEWTKTRTRTRTRGRGRGRGRGRVRRAASVSRSLSPQDVRAQPAERAAEGAEGALVHLVARSSLPCRRVPPGTARARAAAEGLRAETRAEEGAAAAVVYPVPRPPSPVLQSRPQCPVVARAKHVSTSASQSVPVLQLQQTRGG